MSQIRASRRSALSALAATAALASLAAAHPARAVLAPRSDPFTLGVASGAPLPDAVVIWTRLLPAEFDPADLPAADVPVQWEVAEDEAFMRPVRTGQTLALASRAHTVHVDVRGLLPARPYYYRFHAGGITSRVGRTRTAPAPDARPAALRFAYASCQHWEQGYFGAYRHLVADDCDLVLFLGDYIYEYGPHPPDQPRPRRHPTPALRTLADYRARHALYKSDPALQAAHAAAPWLHVWDDHEVINDYTGLTARDGSPRFARLRAAAYRAFFEHQPIRFSALPADSEARIYGAVRWGDLAKLHLLDNRQYRDAHACLPPGRRTSELIDIGCAELADPQRTMLGAAQEAWLSQSLQTSGARWNIVAQTTLMAPIEQRRRIWPDGWDGYPMARARLIEQLADPQVSNPVVLGGDVHGWWVSDLTRDFRDPAARAVATEVCGTSITSASGLAQWMADGAVLTSPHLRWAQVDRRGYTLVDVARDRMTVRLQAMDDVSRPDPQAWTLAAFIIEDGTAGAQRA